MALSSEAPWWGIYNSLLCNDIPSARGALLWPPDCIKHGLMLHFLTFVWLGIWLAAQLLWYRLWRSSSSRHHSYWRTALLVSCLAVLLFPVISSDDDAAWARQMQIDCDSVGITQATRVFSRYDVATELLAEALSRAQAPVLYVPIIWPSLSDRAPLAASPFFRTVPVLRGPPPRR